MHRLASLLWRLRRASAIETDLLRIQAEILRDRRLGRLPERLSKAPPPIFGVPTCNAQNGETNHNGPPQADSSYSCRVERRTTDPIGSARQLTLCFQRLANLDNGVFERLGRYESAVARQVIKTLYLLQSLRCR